MWYQRNRKDAPSLNLFLANHKFLEKMAESDDLRTVETLTLPCGKYGIMWTKRVKTRGKMGYQDGGQLPSDSDNLDLTWGMLNLAIPTRKDSSDSCDDPAMQKAYLPMHGNAWQMRQLHCLPKFLFVDRSTSGFGTWRGLILRVTHISLGKIGPGEQKLWISEVPHCKSMGKLPLESDVLTLRCQRQLWKFHYKGNFFSVFGSRAKNTFQTISRTLAISVSVIPPGQGGVTILKITKVCFVKFPDTWLFLLGWPPSPVAHEYSWPSGKL